MGENGDIATSWAVRAVALLIAALTGCLDSPSPQPKPVDVLVVALDTSASTDLGGRCAETIARLRPLVGDGAVKQLSFLALATGDGDALEPRPVIPWTTWTKAGALMESPEEREQRREAFLRQVFETCAANIRSVDASPVYETVDRSIRAIEARCAELARSGYACVRRLLAVHSDFRSMTGSFGFYLKSLNTTKRKKKAAPPRRLPLDGIDATFCGFANTAGGDGVSTDSVIEAWSAVLGKPFIADPTCAADLAFVPAVSP